MANEQAEGPQTAPAAELPAEAPEETLEAGDIGKQLERVKWFLWHGTVGRALVPVPSFLGRYWVVTMSCSG